MIKIKVKPEGREDVYIPEKESLKAWIKSKPFEQIHHFYASAPVFVGADHDVESVLEDIDRADRLGLCTGVNSAMQMGHELSIIIGEQLNVYDIGKLTLEDLEIDTAGKSNGATGVS